MTSDNNPPKSFKIIAIVAVVWNLLGVMAYIMQVTMSPEALAALPQEQQDLFNSTPVWANAAFAVAVWFGLGGSVTLLMKKAMAFPLLVVSLIGIVAQDINSFLLSNALDVYGGQAVIMPVMVLGFAVYLVWFSKSAKEKGWIS